MDANKYQKQAMATSGTHDRPEHRVVNAVLGLAGEAGELAADLDLTITGDPLMREALRLVGRVGVIVEMIKKNRYHGHKLDVMALVYAIGQIVPSRISYALEREVSGGRPDPEALRLNLDRAQLALELGDACWYVAQGADGLNLKLADVMQGNLDKLSRRYPDGFSDAASRDREV